MVKVAYLTVYYNGEIDGRFGRFHDWVHTLRDMDNPPFEFTTVAFTVSNGDETLSSPAHQILGEATDLWASKLNKLEFILNTPRVIRDLRRIKPDVIHVLTADLIAYQVALAFDVPVVVGPDVQGHFPRREGDRWNKRGLAGVRQKLEFLLKKRLLQLDTSAVIVCLSEYHRQNLLSTGVDERRLVTVPPGVSGEFSPARDPQSTTTSPTFLYVGELNEYKGYKLFLRALATLPSEVQAKGLVVGAGDRDPELVRELGLEDTVEFTGFVPRAELCRYYQSADFFVMPSIDENGPNTIVEALACGLPVLVTDKPGINEYHPPDAGMTFERTVDSMSWTMKEAIASQDELREAAQSSVKDFTSQVVIEKLAQIYQSFTLNSK